MKMNDINWKSLINSKCIIINHPFWSERRNGIGALEEVTILETTSDGEYVTLKFMDGKIIEWIQKSNLEFIEKIDDLSSEFNGKWLRTKASYRDNPAWTNFVTEVIVLGTSLSGKYIKLEYTCTDGTKNIRWDERNEIILKYKLDNESNPRYTSSTASE